MARKKSEKFWAVLCPDGIMMRSVWPYGPALFYTKDGAKKYASTGKNEIVKVEVIRIGKPINPKYELH